MAIKHQTAVDPLDSLYFMFMGRIAKKKLSIITMSAFILMSMHMINFLSVIQLWKNTENIETRIQFLIMTLHSSALAVIIVAYSKNFSEIKDVTEGQFISIETRGNTFQLKIKKEAKLCISLSSIHLVLTICMVWSFVFYDKRTNSLIFDLIQTIPFMSRWVGIIPLSGVLFGLNYLPNVTPFYITYVSFHLRFQYRILLDYLKDNIQSPIDINNENAQQECRVHLQKCVDHIAIIQSGFKRLFAMSNITLVAIYVVGVPAMVIAIYSCFAQGVTLKTNSFMFFSILQYLAITINSCIVGQMITNESENLYNFLCRTPWIHWDKTNRLALLTILINVQKPMKVTAYGVLDLDYTLMIKMIKLSYTLLALLPKLTKWEY